MSLSVTFLDCLIVLVIIISAGYAAWRGFLWETLSIFEWVAAAAALVSSFGGEPLPRDTVFFGEISLSGDIRPVPQAESRLKEAAKLGFKNAFVPAGTSSKAFGAEVAGMALTEVTSVAELLRFAPEPTLRREKAVGRGKVES